MHAIMGTADHIRDVRGSRIWGHVRRIRGTSATVVGLHGHAVLGARVALQTRHGPTVLAEVVGFDRQESIVIPFSSLEGVGPGAKADLLRSQPVIFPSNAWLGRVIDGLAEPLDGKGPLANGHNSVLVRAQPPDAHARSRVQGKVDLGIRSVNTFVTVCRGQRMGIFSGSGVGKSILLSMLARFTVADVIVVGLVGERGREVQEFIQDHLGEEGLKRAVVVVATSDHSAILRREAAYMTMAVAEFFRDQGKHVLCLMDSVTRFAHAQREIGLSAGEPPATRGYTPTVFSELPRLLERAGPSAGKGSVTGIFTVLVEGDDHNEPVADAVRGIIDGHLVLSRTIAHRNRFPAVDVLQSVSRMLPDCNSENENLIVQRARSILATYSEMEELIRLGAYRAGADPAVDEAIRLNRRLEDFLRQDKNESVSLEDCYKQLAEILDMPFDVNAPVEEGLLDAEG